MTMDLKITTSDLLNKALRFKELDSVLEEIKDWCLRHHANDKIKEKLLREAFSTIRALMLSVKDK